MEAPSRQIRLHSAAVPDAPRRCMRAILIGFVRLVVPGIVLAACSQDPGSAATGTSGTGGTGGGPDCKSVSIGFDQSTPCNMCLHNECCVEQAACLDAACLDCFNFYHSGCDPRARAALGCLYHCEPSCYPGWPSIDTTSSGTGGTGSSTSGTGSSTSSG